MGSFRSWQHGNFGRHLMSRTIDGSAESRGDNLAHYRIYMLSHENRIVTGSDADCATDEAALGWAATTLGTDARAEVWQHTRCLGRVSNVSIPLVGALLAAGD